MTTRPGTMGRNFRIPDGLYADVKRITEARGETLTEVVVAAFERYRKRHAAELSAPPAKEQS